MQLLGTTILIVEDEESLANLYATWLAGSHEVKTAVTGEAALELLDSSIDVVLLDRRIPDISGDNVLSEIRDRGYGCRVAVVTAIEPDFDIIEMGFDDYLVKPVTKEELHQSISRLMKRVTYDTQLDEYATLVRKKAVLQTEKSRDELRRNDEFNDLLMRIEELRSSVDMICQEFNNEDAVAMFRDIAVAMSR